MRILVAVATRHGATQGIADSIGEALREQGLDCTVAPVEAISSVSEYDAVVLGSAVYAGRWLRSAREFAAAHEDALGERRTWLFSSGPIGSAGSAPGLDEPDPVGDARKLAERIRSRGVRTFGGRLELDQLGRGERMVARIVRSPEGDFRDWDAIRAWAGQIARDLTGSQMGAV